MTEFERERRGVRYDLVEGGAVTPAKIRAVGAPVIHQEIQEAANAGHAGEQILAGSAAPHGGQLVDGLPDADADIFAALVPTAVAAHDLTPHGKHTVLPEVVGEAHHRLAARVVTIQREAARHERLQRSVIEDHVIG